MLYPNHEDYTAIDFAGVNKSFESLLMIIEYFSDNFKDIEKVYLSEEKDGTG